MQAAQSVENHSLRETFRRFKELSKPGIVALVLISVIGGFLAGHSFETAFSWNRLCLTFLGVLLLASGSSALNQLQEVELDRRMPRTANRPLVSGKLSSTEAIAFIAFTAATGLGVLFHLDTMVGILGLLALVSYNGLYTLWWKRTMAFGAVPGAIPGAIPILIGHVAASRDITRPDGWFFFALLFFWQMPHFWALALRFRDDYAQGGFPILSVARGTQTTRFHIVFWCLAYVGTATVGTLFLRSHLTYFVISMMMTLKLLWELFQYVRAPEAPKAPKAWIRFFLWINFSLIIYVFGAVIDLYSVYLIAYMTR